MLGHTVLPTLQRNPGRWVVRIPEGAQSGNIVVRTRWGDFRGPYFRVTAARPAPVIATMTPASGSPGTEVTLSGSGFSTRLSDVHVTLNDQPVVVRSTTPTEIVLVVPAGATSGELHLRVDQAGEAASPTFTIGDSTAVTDLQPRAGPPSSRVAIVGSGFSDRRNNNRVFINHRPLRVVAASATRIDAVLPRDAASGTILVDVRGGGRAESAFPFLVQNTPAIAGFAPVAASPGHNVTISGANFGRDPRVVAVTLGGAPVTLRAVTPTRIDVQIPTGAASGKLGVTINGVGPVESSADFTVLTPIRVATFAPTSGPEGTEVVIRGEGFSPAPAENEVFIGRNRVEVQSSTTTEIHVRIARVASGPLRVRVPNNGDATTSAPFMVTVPPLVTSFEPTSGPPGTPVTIHGARFGTTTSLVSVRIGERPMAIRSIGDAQIVAVVPDGATTAPISVAVRLQGAAASNGAFQVLSTFATTAIAPTSTFVGAAVTIRGSGFVRGTRVVFAGDRAVSADVMSPTELRAIVPQGAVTGPLVVRSPDGRTSETTPLTITEMPPGVGVTHVEAACYRPGCHVLLNGHGFSTNTRNDRVFFGGRPVRVNSATTATLDVTLPAAPGTNRFRVDVRGGSEAESEPFTIVP